MKLWNGDKFDPSEPEILAAYVDGEFEGCESLKQQKQAVEQWLEQHPQASDDIAEWRELKQFWQDTVPPEPANEDWAKVFTCIHKELQRHETEAAKKLPWTWIIGGAAAALLLVIFGPLAWNSVFPPQQYDAHVQKQPTAPEAEVFPVATAEEVEILRVGGDDTESLVVGNLPVDGPLVLADRNDVQVMAIEPAADQPMPQINNQSERPMVWAGGGLEKQP